MQPTPQPELPPPTQVTTRHFRNALADHLTSRNTIIILNRHTPTALLLPLYLPKWYRIPDLKKARTRTLRRVRLLFAQLIHANAH